MAVDTHMPYSHASGSIARVNASRGIGSLGVFSVKRYQAAQVPPQGLVCYQMLSRRNETCTMPTEMVMGDRTRQKSRP